MTDDLEKRVRRLTDQVRTGFRKDTVICDRDFLETMEHVIVELVRDEVYYAEKKRLLEAAGDFETNPRYHARPRPGDVTWVAA